MIQFSKYTDRLVPVVIQDDKTNKVLMLGFMNEEALTKTNELGKVTFYSRSKKRLWTKGEESGNFLLVKQILVDCDEDTLLIKVEPLGPVCHTGTDTCFKEENKEGDLVKRLESVINDRKNRPADGSYVSSLFAKGMNKIAQKVGEEAVELVIEAKDNNDELFVNEAADLFFHYLILLQAKGCSFEDVKKVLEKREK